MEMMNRAIEDASDYQEMIKKLTQPATHRSVGFGHNVPEEAMAGTTSTERQHGENRQQHRARLRAQRKQRA